jgi:hypothetical protein
VRERPPAGALDPAADGAGGAARVGGRRRVAPRSPTARPIRDAQEVTRCLIQRSSAATPRRRPSAT